jgi:hypothetical protein
MKTYYTEGIDTILVLLNPLFLSEEKKRVFKDPLNRLSLQPAGAFTVLAIQAEWFDRDADYQMQIAWAVYELVVRGVIDFPDTLFTPIIIYQCHEWFILHVIGCDFHFDISEKNVDFQEGMSAPTITKAKDAGVLYRYQDKKTGEATNTFYPADYTPRRPHSAWCFYDKWAQLFAVNNTASHEEIMANQNRWRLEARVRSCNSSGWLHWDNFRGTYKNIFNRYKEYLAARYNAFQTGFLTVRGTENPNLREVIRIAEEKGMVRYRGTRLKKTGRLEKEDQDPHRYLSDAEMAEKQEWTRRKAEEFEAKDGQKLKAQKLRGIMEEDPRKRMVGRAE